MKKEVLSTLIAAGNLLRSPKVSFDVTGGELKVVNDIIDRLEGLVNAINKDQIVLSQPEPGAAKEEVGGDSTDSD
jgi:hypothetical protein